MDHEREDYDDCVGSRLEGDSEAASRLQVIGQFDICCKSPRRLQRSQLTTAAKNPARNPRLNRASNARNSACYYRFSVS